MSTPRKSISASADIIPGALRHPLPSPRPLRILVVDNVADAADTLAHLLTLWGHDARVAYGGLPALSLAAHFHPDVLLLDIGLPGISGFEVARRVQESALNKPVMIAITGYADDIYRETARSAGFVDYLIKPIDPATLRVRLDSLVNLWDDSQLELP